MIVLRNNSFKWVQSLCSESQIVHESSFSSVFLTLVHLFRRSFLWTYWSYLFAFSLWPHSASLYTHSKFIFSNTSQIMLLPCLMPVIFFPPLTGERSDWSSWIMIMPCVILPLPTFLLLYPASSPYLLFSSHYFELLAVLLTSCYSLAIFLNFSQYTMFFYSQLSLQIKSGTVPEHPVAYFRGCDSPEAQVNRKKQRLF